MRSRKSGGIAAGDIKEEQPNNKAEELKAAHAATVNGVQDMTTAVRTGQSGSVVDHESLHMFVEAVQKGQTSVAVECLQKVRDSRQKVAHLMSAVLTCASYVHRKPQACHESCRLADNRPSQSTRPTRLTFTSLAIRFLRPGRATLLSGFH